MPSATRRLDTAASLTNTSLRLGFLTPKNKKRKLKDGGGGGGGLEGRTDTSALSSWRFRPRGAPPITPHHHHSSAPWKRQMFTVAPGLEEMWRPCHMEVDRGIQLVSTGPQRAHSSTWAEERGVDCPLPHKWTTQHSHAKGEILCSEGVSI